MPSQDEKIIKNSNPGVKKKKKEPESMIIKSKASILSIQPIIRKD